MTRILVTGAAGAVGSALLRELAATAFEVVATDIRPVPDLPANARFERLDVTVPEGGSLIETLRPQVIVHLASIVTPPRNSTRAFEHEVDVGGTRRILDAAIAAGTRRLVVTSSGAAYGYHADNPVPLRESDALRGNVEFAYSDHKRQVEEMLAEARSRNPQLEQVVMRVGTVLGPGVENQITALFRKPRLIAIAGSDSPFVFIATEDLARILLRAATDGPPGIYNVAGDGALPIAEIARRLGKPVLRVPGGLLRLVLGIARPLGLSRYGPEQVGFLQYRPVLDNTALKEAFGYRPRLSSAEVFETWQRGAGL